LASNPEEVTATTAALGTATGVAPEGPGPTAPLRRKLAWLLVFRLTLVTVLLGGTAAWQVRAGGLVTPLASALYSLVIATYLASLVFAAWLAAGRALAVLAWFQVLTDVILATAVISLTGYTESVFVFMYSLAIVEGSILLFRRGALWALALSLAAYLPLALWASPDKPPTLTLFAHGGAYLATTALAIYLSEQVRRTGERLAARESDLAAITALQESIVQSVASGLVTLDRDERVTFLNLAGEHILGLSMAEVRGDRGDRWFAAFHEQQGRDETDFVNARGERLRLGYTLFPLRGRDGEQIGRAVIFQDLTRLRSMEERVERSERLAEMGRVAAGLAHELRNPVAAMSGSIELLRVGLHLDADEARLMDIVTREASRLNDLVTRFLDYARPAVPRPAATDLARLAGETLDVFGNDPAAVEVRLVPELAPAPAWCDADQLRQVLWNLVVNGAQALQGRPAAVPSQLAVRTRTDPDGWARLEVEDNGPGIAPQDLPRLFTPFFTTKERGSGLGLATVLRIVDAHHGTVTAGPGDRGGARFVVRLPPRPAPG
jgi:two-component system, NtrC family, sensor histidine kinase PilS